MDVIVEKGKLGNTYHIWDNDNREIACHRQDVVELIRKLQDALRSEKKGGKMPDYETCPLCGSLVPRSEIAKYGYCEVCRLRIEKIKEEG